MAAEYPQRSAIEFAGSSLTYIELDAKSEGISRYLQKACGHHLNIGVDTSDFVAFIILTLGVLKSGRTYVPINTKDPAKQIEDRIAAAKVETILDGNSLRHCEIASSSSGGTKVGPTVPAYIMFTSGSTGIPKAVQCTDEAVLNLLESIDDLKSIPPGRRYSLWTRFTFDVSIYEIYSALLNGGTLVIAPEEIRANPVEYVQWLFMNRIACAYVPPAGLLPLAAHMRRGEICHLERILVGVEPINHRLLLDLCSSQSGLTVVNGYGPTETTVCCTLYRIEEKKELHTKAPIGKPVRHTQIKLIGSDGAEADVGEIVVSGRALATGYLNSLTEGGSGFGVDDKGAATYATGDLAERDSHGDLIFLGRKDRQIKLRGFRFHPLEVETRLTDIPGISIALVDITQDASANDYLAAYLYGDGESLLSPGAIASLLAKELQEFKVPTAYFLLPNVIYSLNDKIDRHSTMSQAGIQLLQKDRASEPLTGTEQRVIAVWQRVLGVEHVHADSEFMLIGGSSLSLLLVKDALERAMAVSLDVSDLFERRTVRELALYLDRLTSQAVTSDPSLLRDVEDAVRRRNILAIQNRAH